MAVLEGTTKEIKVVQHEDILKLKTETTPVYLTYNMGPPGPKGDKGDVADDVNYVHSQAVPDDVWEVTHNLGKHPAVHVEDSAGTEVVGGVTHLDNDSLTITFSAPFSGSAVLN